MTEKIADEILMKLRDQVSETTYRDHILLGLIDEVLEWRKQAQRVKPHAFSDLTDEQRRAIVAFFAVGLPLDDVLKSTHYAFQDEDGKWGLRPYAMVDYLTLKDYGYCIDRYGQIVEMDR